MKIFVVEKKRKFKKIIKDLELIFGDAIVSQNDCNFKMTKNDYTIIGDDDLDDECINLKNIIVLSNDCTYKNIWKLVCKFNLADIIDSAMESKYIIDRIKAKVGK